MLKGLPSFGSKHQGQDSLDKLHSSMDHYERESVQATTDEAGRQHRAHQSSKVPLEPLNSAGSRNQGGKHSQGMSSSSNTGKQPSAKSGGLFRAAHLLTRLKSKKSSVAETTGLSGPSLKSESKPPLRLLYSKRSMDQDDQAYLTAESSITVVPATNMLIPQAGSLGKASMPILPGSKNSAMQVFQSRHSLDATGTPFYHANGSTVPHAREIQPLCNPATNPAGIRVGQLQSQGPVQFTGTGHSIGTAEVMNSEQMAGTGQSTGTGRLMGTGQAVDKQQVMSTGPLPGLLWSNSPTQTLQPASLSGAVQGGTSTSMALSPAGAAHRSMDRVEAVQQAVQPPPGMTMSEQLQWLQQEVQKLQTRASERTSARARQEALQAALSSSAQAASAQSGGAAMPAAASGSATSSSLVVPPGVASTAMAVQETRAAGGLTAPAPGHAGWVSNRQQEATSMVATAAAAAAAAGLTVASTAQGSAARPHQVNHAAPGQTVTAAMPVSSTGSAGSTSSTAVHKMAHLDSATASHPLIIDDMDRLSAENSLQAVQGTSRQWHGNTSPYVTLPEPQQPVRQDAQQLSQRPSRTTGETGLSVVVPDSPSPGVTGSFVKRTTSSVTGAVTPSRLSQVSRGHLVNMESAPGAPSRTCSERLTHESNYLGGASGQGQPQAQGQMVPGQAEDSHRIQDPTNNQRHMNHLDTDIDVQQSGGGLLGGKLRSLLSRSRKQAPTDDSTQPRSNSVSFKEQPTVKPPGKLSGLKAALTKSFSSRSASQQQPSSPVPDGIRSHSRQTSDSGTSTDNQSNWSTKPAKSHSRRMSMDSIKSHWQSFTSKSRRNSSVGGNDTSMRPVENHTDWHNTGAQPPQHKVEDDSAVTACPSYPTAVSTHSTAPTGVNTAGIISMASSQMPSEVVVAPPPAAHNAVQPVEVPVPPSSAPILSGSVTLQQPQPTLPLPVAAHQTGGLTMQQTGGLQHVASHQLAAVDYDRLSPYCPPMHEPGLGAAHAVLPSTVPPAVAPHSAVQASAVLPGSVSFGAAGFPVMQWSMGAGCTEAEPPGTSTAVQGTGITAVPPATRSRQASLPAGWYGECSTLSPVTGSGMMGAMQPLSEPSSPASGKGRRDHLATSALMEGLIVPGMPRLSAVASEGIASIMAQNRTAVEARTAASGSTLTTRPATPETTMPTLQDGFVTGVGKSRQPKPTTQQQQQQQATTQLGTAVEGLTVTPAAVPHPSAGHLALQQQQHASAMPAAAAAAARLPAPPTQGQQGHSTADPVAAAHMPLSAQLHGPSAASAAAIPGAATAAAATAALAARPAAGSSAVSRTASMGSAAGPITADTAAAAAALGPLPASMQPSKVTQAHTKHAELQQSSALHQPSVQATMLTVRAASPKHSRNHSLSPVQSVRTASTSACTTSSTSASASIGTTSSASAHTVTSVAASASVRSTTDRSASTAAGTSLVTAADCVLVLPASASTRTASAASIHHHRSGSAAAPVVCSHSLGDVCDMSGSDSDDHYHNASASPSKGSRRTDHTHMQQSKEPRGGKNTKLKGTVVMSPNRAPQGTSQPGIAPHPATSLPTGHTDGKDVVSQQTAVRVNSHTQKAAGQQDVATACNPGRRTGLGLGRTDPTPNLTPNPPGNHSRRASLGSLDDVYVEGTLNVLMSKLMALPDDLRVRIAQDMQAGKLSEAAAHLHSSTLLAATPTAAGSLPGLASSPKATGSPATAPGTIITTPSLMGSRAVTAPGTDTPTPKMIPTHTATGPDPTSVISSLLGSRAATGPGIDTEAGASEVLSAAALAAAWAAAGEGTAGATTGAVRCDVGRKGKGVSINPGMKGSGPMRSLLSMLGLRSNSMTPGSPSTPTMQGTIQQAAPQRPGKLVVSAVDAGLDAYSTPTALSSTVAVPARAAGATTSLQTASNTVPQAPGGTAWRIQSVTSSTSTRTGGMAATCSTSRMVSGSTVLPHSPSSTSSPRSPISRSPSRRSSKPCRDSLCVKSAVKTRNRSKLRRRLFKHARHAAVGSPKLSPSLLNRDSGLSCAATTWHSLFPVSPGSVVNSAVASPSPQTQACLPSTHGAYAQSSPQQLIQGHRPAPRAQQASMASVPTHNVPVQGLPSQEAAQQASAASVALHSWQSQNALHVGAAQLASQGSVSGPSAAQQPQIVQGTPLSQSTPLPLLQPQADSMAFTSNAPTSSYAGQQTDMVLHATGAGLLLNTAGQQTHPYSVSLPDGNATRVTTSSTGSTAVMYVQAAQPAVYFQTGGPATQLLLPTPTAVPLSLPQEALTAAVRLASEPETFLYLQEYVATVPGAPSTAHTQMSRRVSAGSVGVADTSIGGGLGYVTGAAAQSPTAGVAPTATSWGVMNATAHASPLLAYTQGSTTPGGLPVAFPPLRVLAPRPASMMVSSFPHPGGHTGHTFGFTAPTTDSPVSVYPGSPAQHVLSPTGSTPGAVYLASWGTSPAVTPYASTPSTSKVAQVTGQLQFISHPVQHQA